MFPPADQQPDFPAMEEQVLARWKERDTFARSRAARADGPRFQFYEGPPTANGRPGVHHIEARVFKDIFPRYATMKGRHVPRKAGWDCHGIPVELEVEKTLGFTRKQDIEDYGVEAFNARCRESVLTYVDEWDRLTQRIGFWVDLDDPYWTMDPSYIQSVWWSLKQLWESDLIYEGHKVVPYCARCGTALSDHEVAQGYAQAEDPSVYVRFPLTDGPLAAEGAALLVWTTTPWTLISNVAAAVATDIAYVLARHDGQLLVLAADLVGQALGEDAQVVRAVAADELVGAHYAAPFDWLDADRDWHYVIGADFVTTDEGTGVVHLAPAFGADDMEAARAHDLPVVNPVDLEGAFDQRIGELAGMFVKDADARIIELLGDRGVLHRAGTTMHTYPFCWRCSTPLLYYATPSWYIATTRVRDRLLEVNAGVDWHPEHIRDGRFGDWLEHNVDWALSRSRYWGTPLPLWRCDTCPAITCVGSLEELSHLTGTDQSGLDPHRPFVDAVTFACPHCDGGRAQRVPDVIDAWYDSGSMPFAQLGYPHAPDSEAAFAESFPADFICEAIDQTRGWFYSLMAIATLLFDANSYRTVLVLGHIVDADGRKMSKSVGNTLDPWQLIGEHGADALRWLLLTDGSPWASRRVGPGPVAEVVRKVLLTLWNSHYFFTTYARLDGWTPAASQAPAVGDRAVMDRWVLAELAATVQAVDEGLAAYDATSAGRALSGFVDGLSNWYIRRTRGRFWRSGDDADKQAAFATLHECLVTVAALAAPFVPFLADELYEQLVVAVDDDAPGSVHLLDFPVPDPDAVDDRLRAAMVTARRAVELGRRARNDARVPVRQPLARALLSLPPAERAAFPLVADVIADELNVKELELAEGTAGTVTYRLKPNFRALGRAFGPRTPAVAAAVEAADADRAARTLSAGAALTVAVDGESVQVTADMVTVQEEAREGWQVAADGPTAVALDLAIDPPLRREGLARELIRTVNDLRRQRDLALDDRIAVELAGSDELAAVVDEHGPWIAGEILATYLRTGPAGDGTPVEVAGHPLRIRMELA